MIERPTLGALPNSRTFRGQPLAIMLTVLVLWIGMRASFFSHPVGSAEVSVSPNRTASSGSEAIASGLDPRPVSPAVSLTDGDTRAGGSRKKQFVAAAAIKEWWRGSSEIARPDLADTGRQLRNTPRAATLMVVSRARKPAVRLEQAALQNAGFSHPFRTARENEFGRLSVDTWLFLREDNVRNVGAGPLSPTYGGSQFGAVLRYDLGPRTALLPQAYLRAAGAIDSREADLAAGISIRLLPALPLRVHGEVRLSRLGERVELRPSAFITAGVEENLAPLGARVRGYAQAGYVGGEFATGFADGSLVVERDAKRFEDGALALGFGAWGGAQEGTARLDAGPTASLDMRLGEGRVRLAADYRFRVAGDAEPSSGPAITLSTSF